MTTELTPGIIARLWHPKIPLDDPLWKTAKPILQVVQIRELPPMPDRPGFIRRRGLISDGAVYAPVLFAARLMTRFEEGKLARDSVVCVTDFSCSAMQDRRVIVLLDCEVIETLAHRIGHPRSLEEAGVATVTALPQAAAQPPPCSRQTATHPQKQAAALRSGPAQAVCLIAIANLSPYLNEWTIEARVTDKSEMRHWSNETSAGKLFSCTFVDQSREIRATAFNVAADDLFKKLHVGRTYYVSKARVSITKKTFSDVGRKYELTMDGNTQIEEVGIRE